MTTDDVHHSHNLSDTFWRCYGCGVEIGDARLSAPCPTPDLVGQSNIREHARKSDNTLRDDKGNERLPGADPKTGEYSTAQMLRDEIYGGDTSQPLFD